MSNVEVKIDAKVSDLTANLAVARANFASTSAELRKLAAEMRAAGGSASQELKNGLASAAAASINAQHSVSGARAELAKYSSEGEHGAQIFREKLVLAHESLIGSYKRGAGSLIVLSELTGGFSNALGALFSPITLAALAVAGIAKAFISAASASEHWAETFGEVKAALDATGQNVGVSNAQIGSYSRVETLFPTGDASVAFTPSQGAIGAYYTLNGSTSFMSANQLFLRKFTAPVSGTLNSVSVMPAAASSGINFKPAVYADNSGSPGTLLSSGPQVTGATAGTAVTMALTTPQSLTAGTSYWIGYVTDTSLTMQRQDNSSFSTNAGYTATITYSSAPASTAPSMSSGQSSLQVWGNVTGMTTNYSETNEVPPGGDLSCVSSSTVGAEDRYSFGSLSSTPSNIGGVKVSALLRKTDSGARTATVQLKSGTTEVTGTSQSPTASYLYFSNYQDTDPNTSAAWTASAVNSVSAGAKVAS
jgi:hypothetical protein